MIEHVNLTVATPCPGDNLVLVSLEHDDGRVSKGGTTDGGVRVIGHIVEVTKHDMVCDDIRQRVGVSSDVTWRTGDCILTLESSQGSATKRGRLTGVVVRCEDGIVFALVG